MREAVSEARYRAGVVVSSLGKYAVHARHDARSPLRTIKRCEQPDELAAQGDARALHCIATQFRSVLRGGDAHGAFARSSCKQMFV